MAATTGANSAQIAETTASIYALDLQSLRARAQPNTKTLKGEGLRLRKSSSFQPRWQPFRPIWASAFAGWGQAETAHEPFKP